MSSAGKIRRQSLRLICNIDMTAFLSIQVVLLFLFMAAVVNYPDLPTNGADLPKVNHTVLMKAANREDALVVVVQRDGRIWLGSEKVSPERLSGAIREGVRRGSERKVYVRADAHATFGRMKEVLGAVSSAGVEKVGFLVYQR